MPFVEAHAVPFTLVLLRLLGVFALTPLLAGAAVPARARVLLALVMALALYPSLPAGPGGAASLGLVDAAVAALSELLLGIGVGLLAMLPLTGVQLAAHTAGLQVGFGLSAVYNPAMDTESEVLGELLLYLGIAVFLVLGGLEAVFLALAGSFRALPPGGVIACDGLLEVAVGMLGSAFELGLRVCAPVLVIILVETVATGAIMRTLPQVNVMSIGFGIRVLLGVAALAGSLAAAQRAMLVDTEAALAAMRAWATGGA